MSNFNNKVLIEVAAQHPLIDGMPGEEFVQRLEKGIQIYNDLVLEGKKPIIYVPGNLHSVKENGFWKTDARSLSEAGKLYLIENGILNENIRADDSNKKYKSDGVYNSGDECLVASLIAKDEGIARIISIVSPVQLFRKSLFYLEYGYSPEMYAVGLENTFHNYIDEVFVSLYITYFIEKSLRDLFFSVKTREERNKDYKVVREIDEFLNSKTFIPDSVIRKKEELMFLYNKALTNMESRLSYSNIMIVVELETEEEEKRIREKIDTVFSICKEQNISYDNIKICIQSSNIIVYEKVLDKYFNNINIIKFRTYEEELNYFNSNEISKIYHITDSPRGMNEAILAIKFGLLPIIYSVPNKNISYIDEIEKLYFENL